MIYLDCFSGASGDMVLGALLDLGLPFDALEAALGSLAIEYGRLQADRVLRAGVSATKFRLIEHTAPVGAPAGEDRGARHDRHHHGDGNDHSHDHGHRHGEGGHDHHHEHAAGHAHHSLKQIADAIRRSALSPEGRDRAIHLFERLAQAEASIHQMPLDRVHLHEVGALDSIIDIVGAVYGFEWFGIDDVMASPLNVGSGTVECEHGTFPVPAPATAMLLKGVPIYSSGRPMELVTPTGALLVTAYAREYGPLPAMIVESIGYGAGDRDVSGVPNVLRAVRGVRSGAAAHRVVTLECEIDDMNPQLFGPLMDRLLEAGALDVFYTPVQMKKGRPGTLVTVIGQPEQRELLTGILFRNSTTIGVRYQELARTCLERAVETVETAYGPIRFKIARRDGEVLNAAPEFDDCVRVAAERGLSIKDVQAAAIRARGQR